MLSSMLCSVHQKVTHIRSYKTRLNSDSELIDFGSLIRLNLINNVGESKEYKCQCFCFVKD